jgi:Rrf2 family protein
VRITLRGYYAILALTCLARTTGSEGRTRVEEIAIKHPIPETFLLQIFQSLKRSGLIQSKRGAHGGFQLAKSPDQISLSEIIESVEGQLLPSPLEERADLLQVPASWHELDSFWSELRQKIHEVIDTYSLADLTDRIQSRGEEMYYI